MPLYYVNKSREETLFTILWKVYDFHDVNNIKEVTAEVNISRPNDFLNDRTPHYYTIARSILELETSFDVKALFGVPLDQQKNGTIILFQKDEPDYRFRYRFYYCVTEEHLLTQSVNI